MILTREQILAAKDLQVELVPVPEWGDGAEVGVRIMTGAERDSFEELIGDAKEGRVHNLRAHLCALTLCDAQAGRLFSVEEVEALAEKSSMVLARLFDVARDLNKLTPDEVETAKNASSPDQRDDSGSALP